MQTTTPQSKTAQAKSGSRVKPAGRAPRGGIAPPGRTVQSLERAFSILESIAGSNQPLSLADLSRATGLHTSTTFHLIKTLIVLGYVIQDEARRYRIGPRLFMQAAGAFNEVELVNLAMPHLKRLAEETGETTHLAVRADAGIAVIAKVDARSSIRSSERVGIVRPAYCTAIGKVLLSALPKEDLDAYLRSGPYEAYTPKTITTPAALREEIKRVAAAGTAYDDAEFNHELRCIAAPVRNFTQQTIAAFGISGPVWRVTLKDMQRLSTRVASIADDLSRDLGYRAQAKKPAIPRNRSKRVRS
ncbi:MAG: IclR family transcriptional regulator [Betaproteobacteria bacterium]|nr:IclR family transcriptional regulator [Betaproteobacteria bacterium]